MTARKTKAAPVATGAASKTNSRHQKHTAAGTAKKTGFYRASTLKQKRVITSALKQKRIIRRRTNAQLSQLDVQIIAVLQDDHPQSVRHVYYRMTDPRLPEPVEKTDRGYRHVQTRCVALRRSGRVPYSWFSDLSRRGYFISTFRNAGDFIKSMQGHYRADLWKDADVRCEVWAESRSIASVLQDDCNHLCVSLFPCAGFASLSFIHEAAESLNAEEDDRPVQIFYIGDYDPAGVLIDVTLQRDLREHLRPTIELRFERIGINQEQIAEHDLPTKPRKDTDRRSLHIKYSVEAEAMPAKILRGILRDKVEALLPANALAIANVNEESERAYLGQWAERADLDRIKRSIAKLDGGGE